MMNIIVVFPKIEHGKHIKSILIKGGFFVHGVCVSGARALQYANELGDGIVICTDHMRDMMYEELYQYLPPHFQMLLIASPRMTLYEEMERMVCLSMPLKAQELLHTLEIMEHAAIKRRKKEKSAPRQRSGQEREVIQKAKERLMTKKDMTEEEAHRYIQKSSMDNGTGLTETAQMILSIM